MSGSYGGVATNYFLAKRPTLYFRCQAGEPNLSLRPPRELFVRGLAEAVRLEPRGAFARLFEEPRERPGRKSAARDAGVIWLNPANPPGGTIMLAIS